MNIMATLFDLYIRGLGRCLGGMAGEMREGLHYNVAKLEISFFPSMTCSNQVYIRKLQEDLTYYALSTPWQVCDKFCWKKYDKIIGFWPKEE